MTDIMIVKNRDFIRLKGESLNKCARTIEKVK